MEKSSKCSKLLPYHIIAAAASGDVEAINEVLKHYEGYIAALSTRMKGMENPLPPPLHFLHVCN